MKRRIAGIFALLVIGIMVSDGGTPTIGVAQSSAPTAVLTSCKGPVTIARTGTPVLNASFGMALNDGDEVKTGAGAEAEIMFAAGNWVQIGANSSMRIKGRPGETGIAAKSQGGLQTGASKEEGNFEVVQNFLKLKNSAGTSSVSGLRSPTKVDALTAVSPFQTRVRNAHPTFTWTVQDPSLELRLTVYGESGVLWTHDLTNATSFAYPADAPELKPGVSYSWTLETTDPLVSPPLRTSAAYFEVLAPADAKSLESGLSTIESKKPSPVSYRLMRASLFFDRGLVEDAINETQAALAADPNNGSLHAILGRLYAETGRTKEAIDEINKSQM